MPAVDGATGAGAGAGAVAGVEGAGRSLVSYLLVARPVDTGAKMLVVPLAYLAVHLGGGGGRTALVTAAVVWLVFELGLYEARYELNDLADAHVDRAHVAAQSRGRVGVDARVRRWILAAAGTRLVVAGVVLVLLPAPEAAVLGLGAAGLLAVTVGYEAARSAMRRRPLDDWSDARLSPRELAVFALVGSGYALRSGVGAGLAGADGGLLVAIMALGWAVGTLAVVMAWVDEAAALRLGGGAAVLGSKTHIALLARLVGDDPDRLDQPLLHGPPARLVGWMLAGASAVGVVFGATLGGWPGPVRGALLVAVCCVVGPLFLVRRPSLWAGPAVVVGYALAGAGLAGSGGRWQMAAVLAFVATAPATTRSVSVRAMLREGAEPEEGGAPVPGPGPGSGPRDQTGAAPPAGLSSSRS